MSSASYIKKHPNGIYYVHWTDERIGKRVSARTKSLAEGQAFHAHFILNDGQTEIATGSSLRLADIWSVYDEKHVQPKLAGRYQAKLAWQQMAPHFGDRLVAELDQDLVDDYVKRRTSGKFGRKVKPQTAAKELSYLLAAVRFCADPRRGILDVATVKKFDLPAPGEPRRRWLRTAEIQSLIDAASRLRRGPRLSRGERFLWLALETAGRREALLDLTWDRVDLEIGIIELAVPGRRKTKKGRATVPISKALRPILERAEEEKEGPLVLDNKGAIWPVVQRIAIEAGLGGDVKKPAAGEKPKATGISPHVLRHTAATHMARRGVSLWKIAKILGNTIAVVEKVYAKYVPEDLREAVDAISRDTLEPAE